MLSIAEVQATAVVVGALDAVELDQHLFVGRESGEREPEKHLENNERTQHAVPR